MQPEGGAARRRRRRPETHARRAPEGGPLRAGPEAPDCDVTRRDAPPPPRPAGLEMGAEGVKTLGCSAGLRPCGSAARRHSAPNTGQALSVRDEQENMRASSGVRVSWVPERIVG